MKKIIKEDLNHAIFTRLGLMVLALVLIPILYNLIRINDINLVSPLQYFEFNISLFLPFLFPLFAILIFAQPFSHEFSNHYLLYTRTRIDLKDYINGKLISNASLVFLGFFLVVIALFVFSVYIEPQLGLINYRPELVVDSVAELARFDQGLFTFSQLMASSPWLFAFVYAGWVALNAVAYSSLAILCLLLIPNIFIALSIPFLFYHIASFIIALLGFPEFLFDASIFPFNVDQQSITTVLLPFSVVLILNILTYFLFLKRDREGKLV